MCEELLQSYIQKISNDVYSLEFLSQIYGNIQKPISNSLRQIEDTFLRFQNKWFWKKESEVVDS